MVRPTLLAGAIATLAAAAAAQECIDDPSMAGLCAIMANDTSDGDNCATVFAPDSGNDFAGLCNLTCGLCGGEPAPEPAQDGCPDLPCLNGGTCAPQTFSVPRCECASGFTGDTCEQSVEPAECVDALEATNAGMCAAMADANCATLFAPDSGSDFAGQCDMTCGFCGGEPAPVPEPAQDGCSDLPCLNGGTCNISPFDHQIVCSCAEGFIGDYCGQSANACLSSPCLNGGTCNISAFTSAYVCHCAEGFSGATCTVHSTVTPEPSSPEPAPSPELPPEPSPEPLPVSVPLPEPTYIVAPEPVVADEPKPTDSDRKKGGGSSALIVGIIIIVLGGVGVVVWKSGMLTSRTKIGYEDGIYGSSDGDSSWGGMTVDGTENPAGKIEGAGWAL